MAIEWQLENTIKCFGEEFTEPQLQNTIIAMELQLQNTIKI